MSGPAISVIIPALNEAAEISATIAAVREDGFTEILVVDGGSADGAPDIARRSGAVVLAGEKGRALQMNAGAAAASGEVLVFLHADTRLPSGARLRILEALSAPGVVGGCFRLRFDRDRPLLRLFAWCSRLDSYWTTFGDQAFFVRRAAFDQVGGFPPQPLMEDVELRLRLKRLGRFVKLELAAVTSARRFAQEGLVRRQLLNAALLAGYAVGLSPERLKRFYR